MLDGRAGHGPPRALHHQAHHQKAKAFISDINYKIDVNTLHRQEADTFQLNEIGRVAIRTSQPLFFDNYQRNHGTGSFILMDPVTNHTVAAGMIRGKMRTVDEVAPATARARHPQQQRQVGRGPHRPGRLGEAQRPQGRACCGSRACPARGKSTVARKVVGTLFEQGCQVAVLDGDNVRHGLCGDLEFSDRDRSENIRRVGETSKLFFEQGNITVCTFISPFQGDRDFVRGIIPEGHFFEVHVKVRHRGVQAA